MSIFFLVLNYISTFYEIYLCKKVIDYTTEPIKSIKKLNIEFIIICSVLILANYMELSHDCQIIISILLFLIYYIRNYSVEPLKALATMILYWLAVAISSACSIFCLILFTNANSISKVITNLDYSILATFLSMSLITILSILYSNKIYKLIINNQDTKLLTTILFINLLSLFWLFTYSIEKFGKYKSLKVDIVNIISPIILVYISLFIVIYFILKKSYEYSRLKRLSEIISYKYNHYNSIRNYNEELKFLRHDIKNHISIIKILNKNDLNKADRYIEKLESKYNDDNKFFTTGNDILDIILTEKKRICDTNDVDYKFNINFENCDFIDDIDVCAIFANILDNSIEACLKLDPMYRSIELRGNIVNNMFICKCVNNKSNLINIKNGHFITNKKNKQRHGLGLKNLEYSVKKYSGEINLNYDESTFKLTIIIPLQ